MKIQLWMRGRDERGVVRLYKTITEQEFAEIFGVVVDHDGTRPWELTPGTEREAAESSKQRVGVPSGLGETGG